MNFFSNFKHEIKILLSVFVVAILIAVGGIFLLKILQPVLPAVTLPVGQEITVTGTIVDHKTGCFADGICSFIINSDQGRIEVIYIIGWNTCPNDPFITGDSVDIGSNVEVFGMVESIGRISACSAPEYYIKSVVFEKQSTIVFGAEGETWCGPEPPALCGAGLHLGCDTVEKKWGCFVPDDADKGETNDSTLIEDWQTYRNYEFGLAFQYPSDWSVSEHNTSLSHNFLALTPPTEDGSSGLDNIGHIGILIDKTAVLVETDADAVDTFAAFMDSCNLETPTSCDEKTRDVYRPEGQIIIDGKIGFQTYGGCCLDIGRHIFIYNKSNQYRITLYNLGPVPVTLKNEDVFNQILSTFRFVEPKVSVGHSNLKPIAEVILNDKDRKAIELLMTTRHKLEFGDIEALLVSPIDVQRDGLEEYAIFPNGPMLRGASFNGPIFIVENNQEGWNVIGQLSGNILAVDNSKQDGYSNLTTSWHMSAGESIITTYTWDGEQYIEVALE